jgi:nitrile hydratase beta subunit
VNGVHDLGGSHGHGAVPVDDGATFHEEWEKHLFGLRMAMNVHGIPGGLDALRYAVELLPPEMYLAAAPFERWLISGEQVYVDRGVVTAEEIEARRRELAAGDAPLPSNVDPQLVQRVVGALENGRTSRREVDAEPRFAPGDAVLTRNLHTTEHTRLPRYLRAKRGVVDRLHGAFDLPERAAVLEHHPEHLYEVRFEGAEVWGESAEPNTCIYAQLWESYLMPA